MARPVVIIGLGQLGEIFARGFLRSGRPVVPIHRRMDPRGVAAGIDEPALVMVTVAEADLERVLAGMPEAWRDRVGLVQNELLPPGWEAHHIPDPTVLAVWFEKKAGGRVNVVRPTEVFGPASGLVEAALFEMDIPCRRLRSKDELLYGLALKNVYILTLNIAGLQVGETASELWADRRDLAEAVARELIRLQSALAGKALSEERLLTGLARAIADRPDQPCTGRSAPARLERALAQAERLGVETPELARIQQEQRG